MKTNKYTLSVFSENHIGLLNRLTILLTRRKVNIESLTTSESEIQGIYRFTIVVIVTKEKVINLVKQMEKVVDVLKAFYHEDDETIFQEIALYKVPTTSLAAGGGAEKLIRKYHARVLSVEPEYSVIELTGHKEDTSALFADLEPFGVLEFVRSGRVAITKPMKIFKSYLDEMEALHLN